MFHRSNNEQKRGPSSTSKFQLKVIAIKDPDDKLLDVAVAWAEKQWGPIKNGYKAVFQKLTQPPHAFYIITHELHFPKTSLAVSRILESNPIGMFALRSWKKMAVGTEGLPALEEKLERLQLEPEPQSPRPVLSTISTESSRRSDEESRSRLQLEPPSPLFISSRASSQSGLRSDEDNGLLFSRQNSPSSSVAQRDVLTANPYTQFCYKGFLNVSLHAIEELDYVFLVEDARGVGLSKPVLEIAKDKARAAGAQLMVLQTLNPLVNARYKNAQVVAESHDREDINAPTDLLYIDLRRK